MSSMNVNPNSLKIVGLLSGGKDSCYNLTHCLQNGHQLVALATLGPGPNKDELDSYLYQTVGQDGVHLIAQALDLPLYRRTITGTALELKSEYGSRTYQSQMLGINGDETEDMYELLSEVKRIHPEITAVSVGAILSTYQRVRVEHVCQRLGLIALAYLWKRDQSELLNEMIQSGLQSVLIKVASVGLEPKHLGRSLAEMQDTLEDLNSRYGVHVCGEGGEYETFTIDSPIFKKRINLIDSQVVDHPESSPIAPVAFLKLPKAVLLPKPEPIGLEPLVVIPPVFDHHSQSTLETLTGTPEDCTVIHQKNSSFISLSEPRFTEHNGWVAITSVMGSKLISQTPVPYESLEEEVTDCFHTLATLLESRSLQFTDLAHINLFLRSMEDFNQVNDIYKLHFGILPPTRACIATELFRGARMSIEVLGRRDDHNSNQRFGLHVQSRSYWAPANIGPYSQAVSTGGKIFVAGQIGLIPSSLSLPAPTSFFQEAILSLQHVRRILETFPSTTYLEGMICFVTCPDHIGLAKMVWKETKVMYEAQIPIMFLEVDGLPKGAMVEWQVVGSDGIRSNITLDGRDEENEDNLDAFGSLRPIYSHRSDSFQFCTSPNSKTVTLMGSTQTSPITALSFVPIHVRVFHVPDVTDKEARTMVKESFESLMGKEEDHIGLSTVCVKKIAFDDKDVRVGYWIMGCLN
ncbi:meiotically up-regulated gene 71 protein [Melampsora americana]|nr:meiotically up-regulated gene 71 protein [Melampsora americana]